MLDMTGYMSDSPQDIESHYQKLQKLTDNSLPEAIVVVDLNAVITKADKQTLKMFGWDNEQEVVGQKVFDFVTENDRQAVEQAFHKILADGSVTNIQCTAIKKDRSELRISANGSLFVDSQGSPKEVVVVVHDISSQASAIEQLKEAERQHSEAQQIAHFGSWEWDITSNTFLWTDEMFRLFGITPQSVQVNNDLLIAHVHQEDKENVKNFINQSLEEGSGVLDFRYVNPDNGTTQWFHTRSKTFYDEDHKPLRMVGTVHDVTHEKELDQVKTQFLSLASHQMRGPLTTINWQAEMLLQQQTDNLTENQKKYIQELYAASKQIVQVTNDLLTVSELELGRMPFKQEKLSLPKIIKRVLEDYDHKIAEKKIRFKEVYNGDFPEIETDFFLVKTIFNELISNAVTYTPPEGTITLTVSIDPQRTNTFLVSIADTGYGIPKDQQEKVFSKMFRATNAKEKVMRGTGLGLYIVKLIMKLMGGEIWFTSELDKGSTFYVTLPFVPKHIEQAVQMS
jgi:PAS domain S-box-containing protein